MRFIFVKSRTGEAVTDEARRTVTEAGGKVPANQFWLRRLQNGEVTEIDEPSSPSVEEVRTKVQSRNVTKS